MRRFPLLAILPIACVACSPSPNGGPPPDLPVTVDLAPVRIETVRETVPAVGTLEAEEEVDLSPQISAVIATIHFEEGQRITAGALLVSFDSRKQEARVREVEAAVELSRRNFQRAEALLQDNTVSKEEFDRVAAQLAAEEALLTQERQKLIDFTVLAPFDGVLSRRRVSPGQFLNAGTPMVTLLAVDRLKIAFSVPERFAARLAVGQSVELTVSPHPDRIFQGKVTFIDPRIDPATRTVGLLAQVENRDGALKPGLFANVRAVLSERPGALTIPEEAVFLIGDESNVFIERDGRASLQTVREGLRLDGRVEILAGLSPKDRVVLGDNRKLADGRLLQVRRDLSVPDLLPVAASPDPSR